MRLFTTAASAAITNAHQWQRSREHIKQLETALVSRAVIEQAKGVLMAVHSCTAEEAFTMLVQQSQNENVKLRDVAKTLLDNATRHGGGVTRVVVRDAEPGSVAIEVHDAGPGFTKELLPRAFEPFQRGHAERRGSTSMGLGLALVRRIAEAHGGTAWAENGEERGAIVAMRVARRRAQSASG